MIEKKVRFLEISSNCLFEIQQARRFEKDYFLYGTNLEDALENVAAAKRILLSHSENLEKVMGKKTFALILPLLQQYHSALENLAKLERGAGDECRRQSVSDSFHLRQRHVHMASTRQ